MLARRPGFTLAVVLTLAVGIGANSAIFSVINGLLLKPLPYPEGERLVVINNNYPKMGLSKTNVSIPDYLDRVGGVDALESAALYHWTTHAVSAGERPAQLYGIRATPSLFETLKVQPFLGRAFTAEEAIPGEDRVVILSHGLWKEMFGARTEVIGERVRVDGETRVIVGVMPAGIEFPNENADYFVPFAFTPREMSDEQRGHEYASMIARLAPGADIAAAERQMAQVTQNVASRLPDGEAYLESTGFHGTAEDFREEKVGEMRGPLLLLQVTVGFVLLIACANIANLMLTRAIARQKEMSVRTALGAGRMRIARQLLAESLLLALAGGVAGVLLAHWGIAGLQASGLLPGNDVFDFTVDARVLLFALGVAAGTGLLFGMFPVVSSWRSNTASVLKEGGRGNSGSRGARTSRSTLVVLQVMMAVMLLVAAGLLMRSFIKLQSVSPGFAEEGVLTAQMSLPELRYADDAAVLGFFRRFEERVRALPGVTDVGVTSALPFGNHSSGSSYMVAGRDHADDATSPHAHHRVTDGGYFNAMDIPLLRGRLFDARDTGDSERVVIIDEILAKKFFPDADPVGRQLVLGIEDTPENRATIIGVVGAIRHASLKETMDKETIYRVITQEPRHSIMLAVRTNVDAASITEPLRAAVQALDPELPLYDIATMTSRVERSLNRQRTPMFLLSVFSGVALLLAAIGLYGVLAFSVTQRTGELGVRMALGAARGDLLKLVLGQGGRLVVTGLALGLIGAFLLARLMRSQLYEVSAADPLVFVLVLVFLGITGFIACLLPARRATRVDPMIALRHE